MAESAVHHECHTTCHPATDQSPFRVERARCSEYLLLHDQSLQKLVPCVAVAPVTSHCSVGREFGSHVAGQCDSVPVERLHYLEGRPGPEHPSRGGPSRGCKLVLAAGARAQFPHVASLRDCSSAWLSSAGLAREVGVEPVSPVFRHTALSHRPGPSHCGRDCARPWVHRSLGPPGSLMATRSVPQSQAASGPPAQPGVCLSRASFGACGILPCFCANSRLPRGQGPPMMSSLPRALPLASSPRLSSVCVSGVAWKPVLFQRQVYLD